jgi:hypothetical protein
MRFLFIWTVMVPGRAMTVQNTDESATGGPTTLHEVRGVSREVVEVSTLLQSVESVEPEVHDGGPREVMLDVTLLGRLSNGESLEEQENRPCWRYAEQDDEAIACLVCPRGADCLAHTLLPGAQPMPDLLRYRDVGMRAPLLIRRLIEMSFAAIAARDEDSDFAAQRYRKRRSAIRPDWLPATQQGTSS